MKKNLLGIILCPISIISVVGVGFSGWKLNPEISIETNLNVSDVHNNTTSGENIELDVFVNSNGGNSGIIIKTNVFTFSKYGFDDGNGGYSYETIISGETHLNGENAGICFGANNNVTSFKISAELIGSKSLDDISLESIKTIPAYSGSLINYDENSFKKSFIVTISNSGTTKFNIEFAIKYVGSDFNSFYSLYKSGTNQGFKISLEASSI